jgi:hypothetical protein
VLDERIGDLASIEKTRPGVQTANAIRYLAVQLQHNASAVLKAPWSLKSMVEPFIALSPNFHCAHECGVCSQETVVPILDALSILGQVNQIPEDQAAGISSKSKPPFHQRIRIPEIPAIVLSVMVEFRVVHHRLTH